MENCREHGLETSLSRSLEALRRCPYSRRQLPWFILIMALGNMAMSLYVLIQLFAVRPEDPPAALLCKKDV